MVSSVHRTFILLLCIGYLAVQPDKVSGLKRMDLALRQGQEVRGLQAKNPRILKAVTYEGMNTQKKPPHAKKFDPNESSKRRVRRGSDPIHNRS